jgi:hypothetical protein
MHAVCDDLNPRPETEFSGISAAVESLVYRETALQIDAP